MKSVIFMLCILLIGTNSVFSQKGGRGHGKGNGHGNAKNQRGTRVVVKNHPRGNRVIVKSKYRPAKIVVYHPHWRPNYGYHRRWVYFPRHNFYWDNWRQGYYYRNGAVWIFNTTAPPVIINVNLDKELNYELKEDDDDVDDVYQINDNHLKEFKTESVK
jgi:hypothetical protein